MGTKGMLCAVDYISSMLGTLDGLRYSKYTAVLCPDGKKTTKNPECLIEVLSDLTNFRSSGTALVLTDDCKKILV